tara:strand:+ start:1187 stop:1456 length:270 start_codon:yes stop_codon:yes gene_type:complete
MCRRRNNNTFYQVKIVKPLGGNKILNCDNLEQMASLINKSFFSSFDIVSRSMLSNWIHYPEKSRRFWANAIEITKISRDLLSLKTDLVT